MPPQKVLFRFRPNELKSASYAAKCILACLRCGLLAKQSTEYGLRSNRPYVGCQNAMLVGRAPTAKFVTESGQQQPQQLVQKYGRRDNNNGELHFNALIHFMASYYSRLAEYYRLVGQNALPSSVLQHHERQALKEMLFQSLCTTIQRHYNISKTTLMRRFGMPPSGKYPIPNEDRPVLFRSDHKRLAILFKLWSCVRSGGCTVPIDPHTHCIQTPTRRQRQPPREQQQQQQQPDSSSIDHDAAVAVDSSTTDDAPPQQHQHPPPPPIGNTRKKKAPKVDLSPHDVVRTTTMTGQSDNNITLADVQQMKREYALLDAIEKNRGLMRRHTLYGKFPRYPPTKSLSDDDEKSNYYQAVYDRILTDGRLRVRTTHPQYPAFCLTNQGVRWLKHVRPMLDPSQKKKSKNKKKQKPKENNQ